MHVEADLVDDPGFEERASEIPAAHQADTLARLFLELLDEPYGVGADQLYSRRRFRQGAGEDVRGHVWNAGALVACGLAAHALGCGEIPGLPAHQDGIDG